jgi:RNA polymerase sigma-70 factor (ECF subfamily)
MAAAVGRRDLDDFEAILAAARRRDDRAWNELFRLVSGRVVAFLVSRRCPDPEGVAADVFADLVTSLKRFRGDERQFVSWTLTITHRRMVDAIRAATRRPAIAAPLEELDLPDRADVEGEILGLEGAAAARVLLEQLTPDQADVLTLRIYGELTLPEVADHLGKPLTAVTSLQHRGLEALRRMLTDREPDAQPNR